MPGYDQYQRLSEEIPGSVKLGTLSVTWKDASTFEYNKDGKQYRFNIKSLKADEVGATPARQRGPRGSGPDRGRQYDTADSPDSKLKAFYRDRNVWLSKTDGSGEIAITTDGSEKARVKNGTASWVYGEELEQTTAIWWSPQGTKVAFYRFDESRVPDYYIQMNQTELQSTVDTEAYPKAGVPNPIVDVLVYDVASKKVTKLDVRDGKPFEDDVIGHYVYHLGWTPDGSAVTLNRANRRQNVVEFAACNPGNGKCRGIVKEEWPDSWVENSPGMQYLKDGKRFI